MNSPFSPLLFSGHSSPLPGSKHRPQWHVLLEVGCMSYVCTYALTLFLSFSVSSTEAVISLHTHLRAQVRMGVDTSCLSSMARAFPGLMDSTMCPSEEVVYISLFGSLPAQALGWLRRAGKLRGSLPPSLCPTSHFGSLLPRLLCSLGSMTSLLWEHACCCTPIELEAPS